MAEPTDSDVAAFEEWAKTTGLCLELFDGNGSKYFYEKTEYAWRAWQARGESKAVPDPELERLRQWVDDLQAKMYINCVYCGHKYGPEDEVQSSMADVLKSHVEKCPSHPMSKLKRELEVLRVAEHMLRGYLKWAVEYIRKGFTEQQDCCGTGDEPHTDDCPFMAACLAVAEDAPKSVEPSDAPPVVRVEVVQASEYQTRLRVSIRGMKVGELVVQNADVALVTGRLTGRNELGRGETKKGKR